MPILYQLASYLIFVALLPLLLTHPKLRHGLIERLGLYRRPVKRRGGPCIWLHGASAGDLLALEPILEGLRARLPDATLVVSTLTNSGRLMAETRLRAADNLIYLPYDLPGAVRRALDSVQPELLVLEYTEIWPNLIWAAQRRGSRVAITNGRFSARTLASYRLLFALIGNPLKAIDLFLMRGEDEAERALSLGAPVDRVWVTGNTKFDALPVSQPGLEGIPEALRVAIGPTRPDRPLWIAGSTHDGEEELLLEVLRRLRQRSPRLRLVIAPRYIDRAGRIAALTRERGFSVRLRSAGPPQGPRPDDQPDDVVLLDTIGELTSVYRLGSLVFVGGSFNARGGQNILEPAAAGKPVLFGPNMENFADSVQVLVGRGGIQVKDPEQLYRVMQELLARPEQLAELGAMALAAVSAVRGASERDVEHLTKLLAR